MKTITLPGLLQPHRFHFHLPFGRVQVSVLLLLIGGMVRAQSPGELDTSFNPGTGADWRVLGIARQVDGKLVVGGQFSTFNGQRRNRITRLNENGSTDFTFDPGNGPDSSVNAVALTPDGKIIVAGDFNYFNGVPRLHLARLNTDGSVDPAFAPSPGVDGTVQAVVVQPDGRLLIAGGFSSVNGTSRSRVARLNPDGSLDTDFDPGTGPNGTVLAIVLQNDGNILIGGYFGSVNGTSRNRVARLNSNGTVDAAFAPGTADNGYVNSISVTADGKVFIAGGIAIGLQSRLLRLQADGAVDNTFSPGNNAISSDVTAVVAQRDGKVLFGGYFTTINGVSRNGIARMNADGTLDAAFNPGAGANQLVWTLLLQPDGRLVAGGAFTTYDGVSRNRITRIHNDGAWANQAPLMAAIGNLTVLEDAALQNVTVTGISPGLGEVAQTVTSLTASSSDPTVIPHPSVTYVPGAVTATLAFTPVVNANGVVTLSVVAQDNGGTANGGVDTTTRTFTVTVTAVNDAPSFSLNLGATLAGWGRNDYSQTVAPVEAQGGIVAIEGGGTHTLVLKQDGQVVAWGDNTFGQSIVPLAAQSGVTAIATHGHHSLALKADGSVVAWGNDSSGQTTVPPEAASGVTAIAAGFYHSLALKNDGSVVAWGLNTSGQATVPPEASSGVIAIAAGWYQSLALKSDGSVVAWGATSVPVAAQSGVIAVAAGINHSLALKADGSVVAWGENFDGQTTVPAAALSGVTAIAAGGYHSLALKDDGSVLAWGKNDFGAATVLPAAGSGVVAIAGGGDHSLALVGANNLTVAEDAVAQSIPLGIVSISPGPANEAAQVVSFVVGNNNPALFSSAPAFNTAGTLTYTPALNANGSATVTVYAQDNGGVLNGGDDTSDSRTFTITVTPVNDAPALAAIGVSGMEEATLTFAAADFTGAYSDVEGTPLASLTVVTLPATGTLKLSGADVVPDQVIPAADLGNLTYVPVANEHGAKTFTVTASDGSLSSAVATVTMTLANVNDAPTFTPPANLTVLEDSLTAEATVTAIAPGPNEAAQTVTTITAVSSDPAIVPHPVVTYTAGAATATLTFAPALNAVGVVNISVTAQDDGGTANGGVDQRTSTFTLTVSPVNDAPTVTLTADNIVVAEDSGAYSANVFAATSVGPADEVLAGQTLTSVALQSVSNPGLFSAGPTLALDGTLAFTPAANANGAALVTFTVQDDGGTANGGADTRTVSFTITVTAVNDVPSFALALPAILDGFGNQIPATSLPVGVVVNHLAIGTRHNLAVLSDGTVRAWGANGSGQARVPAGLTGVIAAAAGAEHSLALKSDGTVVAWGLNGSGQASVPAGLSGVIAIAAGDSHSLALKSDGTVVAWGSDASGQSTVLPADLSGVVAIAAGANHSMALKSDQTVVAWGANGSGQATVPGGLAGVTSIAAGELHSLASKSDGTVVAWGDNTQGQTDIPLGLSDVAAVAAGRNHSLARKSDGTVVAWGDNSFGKATVPGGLTSVVRVGGGHSHSMALRSDGTLVAWGDNWEGERMVPSDMNGVIAIASGTDHNLALKADGTVIAWGNNSAGQATVPPEVSGVLAVAAGDLHNLALKSDGTVVAWGSDAQGQSTVPVGLSGVVAVAAGDNHSLALKSDGTVVAWGSNADGQRTVPDGLSGVVAIAAGGSHSLALKNDGTVVAWGSDGSGQSNVPADLSGVVAIAAGGSHSLALRNNGTVAAWGWNAFGQSTVPADLSGVTVIAAGVYHSLAVQSGGTVVAWGYNNEGQSTVPAGLSGVTAIAGGQWHTLVLKRGAVILAEDSGAQTIANAAINISAGPANESSQSVNFTVLNNNNALFSAQPAIAPGGTLTFTPAANANGVATVTVTAVDDGGLPGVDTSAPQTFTITVTAVNDAPSFTKGADQLVFPGDGAVTVANWATSISVGPADEVTAGQTLAFTVINGNNALFTAQPAVSPSGTLTYTPALDAVGSVMVSVSARDSGGTAYGGVDTSAVQTFTITFTAVKVFVSDSPVVIAGSTVEVPISLAGIGTESGVSFTLTYDRPRLVFMSMVVEPGSGLSLTWTEPYDGMMNKVGIIVTKAAGATFAAGTNVMLRVTFQAPVGTVPTNTPLAFSSTVVLQQVSDATANVIPNVLYVPGSVTVIAVPPIEGDVAPRAAGGNGAVTVSDAVQLTRFVAGWDAITDFTANGEFQRADCAPRDTRGDGRVTLIDLVQTLRYAAGLDPATAAGGPTLQAASLSAGSMRLTAGSRVVRVVGGNLISGRANLVSVQLDAQGNEAGVSLSLTFDPTVLTFVGAVLGNGASGGSLVVNNMKAAAGKVGLVLVMPAGTGLAAGPRDIITLTFNVTGTGSTTISMSGDSPVAREVADVNANLLGASFADGSFNLILPAGLKAAGVERMADGSLRLVVGNSDGTPITALQAAKYQVHVTSNLGGAWTLLPNALVIEGGALKIVDPSANGASLRLYKLVETP